MSHSDFNLEQFLELMVIAFKNENYEEANRYVTLILDNVSNPSEVVWLSKGLITGHLSTPEKPRIREMIDYLEKARAINNQNGNDNEDFDYNVATGASFAVSMFTGCILDFFSDLQNDHVSSVGSNVVLTPDASLRGLLITGSALRSSRKSARRQAAKEIGNIFKVMFQPEILAGFEYTWSVNQAKSIATNTFNAFEVIIRSPQIDTDTKIEFIDNAAASLISDIKRKHSELTLPKIRKGWFGF